MSKHPHLKIFRVFLVPLFVLVYLTGEVSAEECVPAGKVLLPASDEWIDINQLIQSSAESRIVLLGEHHNNAEHHRWQLQMVTGLHTLHPKMALGFEMFPRKAQPVLDKWVKGELSEAEFLKQVDWEEYWSFDAQLYLPIFHYARMNKIPMYALNVDRNLIREVGKQGWTNVSADLKEGIGDPAPASEGYQQMLASVFMQHGENHDAKPSEERIAKTLAMPAFKRFVEGQQVWDRAMAEGIANAAQQHPQAHVVAILGSGHMMYHFGVPEQLLALDMPKSRVLVPWDPEFECDYIQKDFSDAVIGLQALPHPEQQVDDHPRLGVYLEPAEGGVLIAKLVEDSIAEKIGLQKGDLIVNMAGRKVTEVTEVIDIVKATRFGTWLPLTIKREDKPLEFVAKFPPNITPHTQ